jgi:hypothetical protein
MAGTNVIGGVPYPNTSNMNQTMGQASGITGSLSYRPNNHNIIDDPNSMQNNMIQ